MSFVSLRHVLLLAAFLFSAVPTNTFAQTQPVSSIDLQAMVDAFKVDPRGPFQIVRWFCPDGTVIPARERCAEPGGKQRAVVKDEVARLQSKNGIYLGQILTGTDESAFLDEANSFSRLKQYQLEKYLARVDDGWIFRKARYYRGAYQIEDEEEWGREFLRQLAGRGDLLTSRYFFVRQAVRDIPHSGGVDVVQKSRALAQEIADAYRGFTDIRVKIHGQPDSTDIQLVQAFRDSVSAFAPAPIVSKLSELRDELVRQYRSDYAARFESTLKRLGASNPIAKRVRAFDVGSADPQERVRFAAELSASIRDAVLSNSRWSQRLALLDLSLSAEELLFRSAVEWRPATVRELLLKAHYLREAAYGSGLLERWEYDEVRSEIGPDSTSDAFPAFVLRGYERSVEWSAAMVTATYSDVVDLYAGFEPLARSFVDDRIRSSVLLPFGDAVSQLGGELALRAGLANDVLGQDAPSARGLNSGVTVGTLEVVTGNPDDVDFQVDRIYVMVRTPSDLKPVAGIATATEGNRVSHVQLLARNLGIPNAVFPPGLIEQIRTYSGMRVFYAVSPNGRVRMKPVTAMSTEERALVEVRTRAETQIRVPTERLALDNTELLSLYDLRATDSGRVCGPKAANLGQLSALFPGRVAPGFIVPFGRFREHMDQEIPGKGTTYWTELHRIFDSAAEKRTRGISPATVDDETVAELADFRVLIEKMPLKDEFVQQLRARFREIFGSAIGETAVFVRSDTNMEDLKDFTGAGLNLTVPNVVRESDILDAVRRVWASPFRERGYRWRQRYLLNPEDVYPSLLLLKSVNAQKSGVMITTGIASGSASDFTVAFNRGVGGAVDGQAAETWNLHGGVGVAGVSDRMLIAPAREPLYTVLPGKGGIEKRSAAFDKRVLSTENLDQLRAIGADVRRLLPGQQGIETNGPFDVELGFDGSRLILFQARPFVENKAGSSAAYLLEMDRSSAKGSGLSLDSKLSR